METVIAFLGTYEGRADDTAVMVVSSCDQYASNEHIGYFWEHAAYHLQRWRGDVVEYSRIISPNVKLTLVCRNVTKAEFKNALRSRLLLEKNSGFKEQFTFEEDYFIIGEVNWVEIN